MSGMGKLGWRWLRAGMLAGILLLCFCTATFAMPPAASWSGVLREASGNPVAAAEVVLAEVSGKPGYTTDTKANGEFRFAVVALATYRISVVTEGGIYECAQAVVVPEAGS